MSAEALNLEAISKAIKQHDERCTYPVVEIRMAHFEVKRLGWEEFQGIPIVGDDEMGTGRFKLVCERDLMNARAATEALEKRIPSPGERVPV
jgi:hypothetical protein